MTAKRKDGKGRGGATLGGGAPRAPLLVDPSSPLMRGLGKALVEAGQPSVYQIAKLTGVHKDIISHAVLHGRTPAAVRSIERILAGLGYIVTVVRLPKDPRAPGLDP